MGNVRIDEPKLLDDFLNISFMVMNLKINWDIPAQIYIKHFLQLLQNAQKHYLEEAVEHHKSHMFSDSSVS